MKNCSKVTRFACGLLVTLLSGCVTAPKTDMNAQAREKLHSIALLEVAEPRQVGVINLGGAAGGFGLIGALAQVALNTSHTNTYTERVTVNKIAFVPDIVDGVTGRLADNGYQIVKLNQKPKRAADGKSDDYSDIQTDADAIMNVWFTSFGYISPASRPDYIPSVAGIGPGGGCNDDDDHERDDGRRAEMTSSAAGQVRRLTDCGPGTGSACNAREGAEGRGEGEGKRGFDRQPAGRHSRHPAAGKRLTPRYRP